MKYLADFELAAQSGAFKGLKPARTKIIKEHVLSQNKYGVWVTQIAAIARSIPDEGFYVEVHEGGDHDPIMVTPYFDVALNGTAKDLLSARQKLALLEVKRTKALGNDK